MMDTTGTARVLVSHTSVSFNGGTTIVSAGTICVSSTHVMAVTSAGARRRRAEHGLEDPETRSNAAVATVSAARNNHRASEFSFRLQPTVACTKSAPHGYAAACGTPWRGIQ